MLKEGTLLGNRYEIIEKIGAGGMSIVYKAKDIKLERIVTVKVLREEFIADEEFVSRFNVEARAAASLSHQNIVNVYDVGTEYDTYYIVMEYINGTTLKDIINNEAPFDNERVIDYAIKIASALQHAHKNHIVHRDIKPQNILVSDEGILKVTDFGIAHAATSSTLTMTTTAIGSVHYFSPEQARGGYIDEKSDLYSLGIVMYEMITGTLPFTGDSSVSIALKHINDDLPPMSEINPNINKSLEGIILKLTQKRADQRYNNVDELLTDLYNALKDPSGAFIKSAEIGFVTSETQKFSDESLKKIREGIDKEKSADKEKSNKEKLDELYKGTEEEEYEEDDEEYDDEYEDDEEDDEEESKGSEIKVMFAAIVTAFAIIALLSVVGYNMFFKGNSTPGNITVNNNAPYLIGKTLEEAQKLLEGRGITIHVIETQDNTIQAGYIINQKPEAGSPIDGSVTLTVSLGSALYDVPELTNKNLYTAETQVENMFVLEVEYKYDDEVEILSIISQEPKAGEKAALGSKIKVVVSSGAAVKNVNVPSIVGLTKSAAEKKLESAGLVGSASYEYSDTVEEGKVISQKVASGKEVSTNEVIGFVVSKGKSPVTEPSTNKSEIPSATDIPANPADPDGKEDVTQPSTEQPSTEPSTEKPSTEPKTEPSTEKTSTEVATQPSTEKSTVSSTTAKKKVIFRINNPELGTGVDKVEVAVVKITDEIELSKKEYSLSQFPLDIEVEGEGQATIQIIVNGIPMIERNVNFDTEGV